MAPFFYGALNMLLAIRDRVRGWVAYLVVGLLAVPFALFGLYNYLGDGTGDRVVATVEGEEITRGTLDERYRSRQAELRQMLGDQFDLTAIDGLQLRRQVLNELVDRELLLNYARDEQLQVSDADIARYIRQQEFFQADGEFSVERYRALLARNNLTPERYEAQVRQDLATQLVQGALEGTVYASDRELERLLALQNQRREIAWTQLPAASFADQVSLDQASIESWYSDHNEQFRREAQVRVEYIRLDAEALAAEVDVSDDAVRELHEERMQASADDAERSLRHILVQVAPDADDAEVEQAREAIIAARSRIEEGEGFAEVAVEVSDDSGSARQGGDLGTVSRGDLVAPFADAAWNLAPGELSDPVRTEFGWHLIEVTEAGETADVAFEEVADELRQEIAEDRARQRVFERGNELELVAFENPDSLEPAAQAVGLEVQESDWIPRSGRDRGIGSEPAVLSAAFSEALLERRENSDLIELDGSTYVVLRVADHEPSRIPDFTEVEDHVTEVYREERALELAEEAARSFMDSRQPSEALEAAAAIDGAQRHSPRWAGRGDTEIPGSVRQEAFRLYLGDGEQQVAGLASLGDGYAIVAVSGVEDGDPDAVDAAEREQLRNSLNRVDGDVAIDALIHELRQRSSVRIYEERL